MVDAKRLALEFWLKYYVDAETNDRSFPHQIINGEARVHPQWFSVANGISAVTLRLLRRQFKRETGAELLGFKEEKDYACRFSFEGQKRLLLEVQSKQKSGPVPQREAE